jgi:hypothetical protein
VALFVMSGGHFDYLQYRHEWDDAIEEIKRCINENPYEFDKAVLDNFIHGLEYIKKAKVYLHRIDWLLSGDDGEQSFLTRLQEDLKSL